MRVRELHCRSTAIGLEFDGRSTARLAQAPDNGRDPVLRPPPPQLFVIREIEKKKGVLHPSVPLPVAPSTVKVRQKCAVIIRRFVLSTAGTGCGSGLCSGTIHLKQQKRPKALL